jgi:hypothetical protein
MPALVDQVPLSHFTQLVDAIGKLVATILDIDRGVASREIPAIDVGNAGQGSSDRKKTQGGRAPSITSFCAASEWTISWWSRKPFALLPGCCRSYDIG